MKRNAILLVGLLSLAPALWGTGTEQSKESYVKEAQARLSEWSAKVETLEKRSERAGTKTRIELDRQVQSIRKELEVVRKSLAELTNSGESGWTRFSQKTDEAFYDVKHAYRKAVSFMKHNEDQKGKPGSKEDL